MAVSGVGATSSSSNGSSAAGHVTTDALQSLDVNDFLKLMISELQNQDPLNPMDNSQLLQQISQMREIAATGDMTSTLQAVLLGQNVSSGSALIGKEVSALTDAGDTVTGTVDKVNIAGGDVTLQIGDNSVRLSNVSAILPSTLPFLPL